MRAVTERDLRMPEFRDANPEDLEFRDDGKLVRKDRWEVSLRNVVSAIGWARREFEVHEVSAEVRRLKGIADAAEAPRVTREQLERWHNYTADLCNRLDINSSEVLAEMFRAWEATSPAELYDSTLSSPIGEHSGKTVGGEVRCE